MRPADHFRHRLPGGAAVPERAGAVPALFEEAAGGDIRPAAQGVPPGGRVDAGRVGRAVRGGGGTIRSYEQDQAGPPWRVLAKLIRALGVGLVTEPPLPP